MHTNKLPYNKLFGALGISIMLNALAVVFYFYKWQDRVWVFTTPTEESPAPIIKEKTIEQEALLLVNRPKEELFHLLQDQTPVSDGYTRRDLALAVLTSIHHFDTERALKDCSSLQKRKLLLPSGTVTVYVGLSEQEYASLLRYIQTEKWPFTPEGLFSLMKTTSDPSLAAAFINSEEYVVAKTLLLRKSGLRPEQAHELLIKSNWQEIQQLNSYKLAPEETLRKARNAYFVQLLDRSPAEAAEACATNDPKYASRVLNDQLALLVLERVKDKAFAQELLKRPRSDAVWKKASSLLSSLPKAPLEKKPTIKKSITLHLVQKGDSLWSISRKYHVSIEQLKKYNNLQSDALKPGTQLLIPPQKN